MPEILEVGLDIISYPYMISTAADGVEATHHPLRLEILRELGEHAATINSIRTTGFGETFDWSENRLPLNSSFKEYLTDEYCYKKKLRVLEHHGMLPTRKLKHLKRIFKDAASASPEPRAVLNHGDLRLKNVIVDEKGRIKAILDWQNSTSNIAPQWEISFALHDLGIDAMHHFLEGYGLKPDKLNGIMPLAKAFNIANYAPAIERAANRRDKLRLQQYKLRLSGSLDMYSFDD